MSEKKFSKKHEWVSLDGEVATVGITKHATEMLGDIVFVEVPDAGKVVEKEGQAAVVESTKAASDVYSPISEYSDFTYPIATEAFTLGPKDPLVTNPISSLFDEKIFVFSLAITFPSGFIPTLIFSLPFANKFFIFSQPLKPPTSFLFLAMAHFKLASTGFIFSFKS